MWSAPLIFGYAVVSEVSTAMKGMDMMVRMALPVPNLAKLCSSILTGIFSSEKAQLPQISPSICPRLLFSVAGLLHSWVTESDGTR